MYSYLITLVVMFGVFYIIVLVPENRRKKKYGSMLSNLKINDEVVTRGGVVGKIVHIEDRFLTIQTGPDKIKIKIDKNGVSYVLAENTEESKEK